MVEKDAAGKLQEQQDSQQWDQVVWTVGAWHHYLVTGDREFLRTAYEVVTNTLGVREQATVFGYNARYGLFTGPSFFNDGVSSIDMMHSGLFGLRFDDAGLTFAPTLPAGWGDVTLSGLRYRDARLTVKLHGSGTAIRSFELDGSPVQEHGVPASVHGDHTIDIQLGH
ncbi:glycosyl hydrolase family 65 protein [Kribbella sindirgiensis]|uniref:Glycoside hydrolase family 65 C-terminal domain-containing protein n=1 Tax=Kribbella sindirgiensis TaxID=1124744 RepID=A0A4R0I7E6_9ACTN|nr:glycosyl hydrolase family 65 protein [Kribbella sindirgiensis]TCC24388.1 hypothetical protein E0H50_32625 [Kribbella sindirgiensis]